MSSVLDLVYSSMEAGLADQQFLQHTLTFLEGKEVTYFIEVCGTGASLLCRNRSRENGQFQSVLWIQKHCIWILILKFASIWIRYEHFTQLPVHYPVSILREKKKLKTGNRYLFVEI